MASNNVIKTFTVKINTETGELKINGITKSIKEAQVAFDNFAKSSQNVTKKGVNPLADATGLAGAAVTELGRGITDLNYGFPAIANNISQLGSLFTILTARAGGFTNALKLMWQTLKGPLGILLAFQAVVTVIEAFAKKAKQADDTVKNLNNTFSKQSSELQSYLKILNDSNVPLSERQELVEKINKEHKDLNIQLDEEGRLTEDSKNKTLLYVEALKQKAKAQAILIAIQNNYQKQLEIENEEISESVGIWDMLTTGLKNFGNVGQISTDLVVKGIENQSEKLSELNEQNDEYIKKLNQIGVIPDKNNEKAKKASQRRIKIFKEQLLTFEREEESYRKQSEKAEAIHEEDKIEIRRQAALRDLELKHEDFKLDQSLRLQQFLFQLDLDKKSELAKAKTEEEKRKIEERYHNAGVDAVVKYNESLIQANSNYLNAIDEANKSFNTQTEAFFQQQALKDLQGFIQQMQIGNDLAKQFQIDMATNEMDRLQAQDELRGQQFEREKGRLERQIEVDQGRGLATEELEQKLANLKERNRQEDVKSTEKAEKIKLSIANQVGDAIIGIAGKGSAIGKAVAVAMAIMNTKEAITNALGSKPYGPWNIAQAVAVGAFGFKQVKDILSTKLPVGTGGGGGAGAAPTTVEAPDFNVVGAGTGSQLAQAVGASQSRPFRAYVVSGDVSSAQEFDRKTVNQAALG
jgi:hypothetical protein